MKHPQLLDADMDSMIARCGWAVQAVFGEGTAPPFAYTVGLAAEGLPELIVFGLPPRVAHQFLNQLGRRLRDGEQLPTGTDLHDVAVGFTAQLVQVPRSAADQYMFATLRRYPGYQALQLVWPDTAGRFPWESGFDQKYKPHQPVLRDRLY